MLFKGSLNIVSSNELSNELSNGSRKRNHQYFIIFSPFRKSCISGHGSVLVCLTSHLKAMILNCTLLTLEKTMKVPGVRYRYQVKGSHFVNSYFRLIEGEWRKYASVDSIIIGSYNGLAPGRRHDIIWTNAGLLLSWPLRTNFSEILIKIHTFPFKKMHLKMSSRKCRPSCLGLNVLMLNVWTFI